MPKCSEARKAYMRKYYAANKHNWSKRTPEKQAHYNAGRREKYRTDEEYRQRTKAEVKAFRKRSPQTRLAHILRQYGITIADFERMRQEQGGCCAVCGRSDSADKRGYRLHVDHCHATGKVRGLLCSNCNLGIGKFGDKPELLDAALQYVRKHLRTQNPD